MGEEHRRGLDLPALPTLITPDGPAERFGTRRKNGKKSRYSVAHLVGAMVPCVASSLRMCACSAMPVSQEILSLGNFVALIGMLPHAPCD